MPVYPRAHDRVKGSPKPAQQKRQCDVPQVNVLGSRAMQCMPSWLCANSILLQLHAIIPAADDWSLVIWFALVRLPVLKAERPS